MAQQYTCFVISPIGQEGTEIYEEYQDLLELIIKPALEIYNIKVERGDHSTSSKIDDSVIRSVQEADICICDISEPNPNVYYELGRRDETGKPILLMKKKDSPQSPVDIATRRYLEYSWEGRYAIRDAQNQIRTFIEPMIAHGFEKSGKSASLTDISETLRRVERKLDKLSQGGATIAAGEKAPMPVPTDSNINPVDQLKVALMQRNIPMAESAMQQLAYRMDKLKFYDQVVGEVAAIGSSVAGEMMVKMAEEFFDSSMSFGQKVDYLGCLVSYANKQDKEQTILELVETLCSRLEAQMEGQEKRDVVRVYNQKNRLYHGIYASTGDLVWLQQAIESLNMALRISPEVYVYYNLSVCYLAYYKATKQSVTLEKAMENIDLCLAASKKDNADHLQTACEIYALSKDPRVYDLLERLEKVNSYKAVLLRQKLSM